MARKHQLVIIALVGRKPHAPARLFAGRRRSQQHALRGERRKQRAEIRANLGIERDPLLDARADDGLAADERNVAESVAREKAAEKATDPLLRESAAILADAVALLGKDAALAAQVLPVTRNGAGHWAD